MSILVALSISSLIVNNSVLRAVIRLAGILEDNICCSSFQKCMAEIAYMFLGGVILTSVTTMRVGKKEEALRYTQSRDSK